MMGNFLRDPCVLFEIPPSLEEKSKTCVFGEIFWRYVKK